MDYLDINKTAWNIKTDLHKQSKFYDVEGFLAGKNTLNSIELTEIGAVKDKTLLHLQCHFGLDTLSWARLGAKVTGLDFSDEAITFARQLNQQLGLDANFVQANVYDAVSVIKAQFDIVFTSYGVIAWLPDLEQWAANIAQLLKPGGVFYMAEFHPMVWMFDEDFTTFQYPYFNKMPIEETTYSYVEIKPKQPHKIVNFNHSLMDVINALCKQNLMINFFNEYDYSPYDCFNKTIQIATGKWQIAPLAGKIPLVFTIKATK